MTRSRILSMLSLSLLLAPLAFPDEYEPERVSFQTEDKVSVVGDFHPAPLKEGKAPAALLLHMVGKDRKSWDPLVPALVKAGFHVLAIDLRGCGESTDCDGKKIDAATENLYPQATRDAAAAAAWLRRRPDVDPDCLTLVGASVGCSIALDFARGDSKVAGAVLLSPGTDYKGIDSLAHIKDCGCPLWIIAPEKEVGQVKALREVAMSKKLKTEAKICPGSSHGTELLGSVKGLETEIATWLSKQRPQPAKGGRMYKTENPVVEIETSLGKIAVELFPREAPKTVDNFLKLVEKKYYDGVLFHRVIPGFMIQTGDPTGTGRGGPAYTTPDEFNPKLRHDKAGVVSMANAGPNTGGSQFFITHGPTPHLNDKHAIFGQVIAGLDVVTKIGGVPRDAGDRPKDEVKMLKVRLVQSLKSSPK